MLEGCDACVAAGNELGPLCKMFRRPKSTRGDYVLYKRLGKNASNGPVFRTAFRNEGLTD